MTREKQSRRTFRLGAILLALILAPATVGCSSVEAFGGSRQAAADWAAARGFSADELQAGGFVLAAFVRRPAGSVDTLTIYIEGDGAAWPTPYHPPRDPTPRKPVALALAAADPAPAVAYLGRPCQYLDDRALAQCASDYWVERRFAPEVIDAYDKALDALRTRLGARRLHLVGYSGGGVIAALLAARRSDIDRLITVAAPLAVGDWSKWHGVSPLTGSLDPSGLATPIPAGVHFVGGNDRTVPTSIVESFIRRKGGRIESIGGFDHECCWSRDWASLLQRTLAQEKAL